MYKTEGGISSFMSGSSARVLWLLPFTVIHLGAYESAFWLGNRGEDGRRKMLKWSSFELNAFPLYTNVALIILPVSKRILADLKPNVATK
jgi:hypothetical protein